MTVLGETIAGETRRVEVLALDLGAGAGDKARPDHLESRKLDADITQEGITGLRRDRLGGGHHGGEFGVGE